MSQREHVAEIRTASDAGRRMQITNGRRHSGYPDTGLAALNGSGIISTGNIFLGLPGNAAFFGGSGAFFDRLSDRADFGGDERLFLAGCPADAPAS